MDNQNIEQEQVRNDTEVNKQTSVKNRKIVLFTILGVVLLIIIFILGYFFLFSEKNTTTSITQPTNQIDTINKVIEKVELEHGYSTDGQFVYYRGSNQSIIRCADPETFIVLDEYYSKDKNNIYYQLGAIEEADYDTFQILGYGYAKDKNTIFLGNHPGLYNGDNPNDDEFFKLEKKIDIASFVVLGYTFFKDKNIVMYDNRYGGTSKVTEIVGADPDTFEVIGGDYSKDKNNIYIQSVKSDITDYNTLNWNLENDTYKFYATDKNGAYFAGQKIVNVDLPTFEVLTCHLVSGCFAKDKNIVYNGGNILENADSETFEIMFEQDQPEYERDKNNVWHRGELVGYIETSIIKTETSFDNCGQIVDYKNKNWYSNFISSLRHYKITGNDISELCLSLDGKKLVAITKGDYCTAGNLFQYNTINNLVSKAKFEDHERGCVSWPKEFGKREGKTISLQGFGGDAGCGGTMYYDYSYIENTITLIRECTKCEGDQEETCKDY